MDRNRLVVGYLLIVGGSLSARRAWIEIGLSRADSVSYQVALRKESVDRNNYRNARPDIRRPCGRSPQGERG